MLQGKRLLAAIILVVPIIIPVFQLQAQTLKGQVTDALTGEPMTGATVLLKENGAIEYVKLDGKFSFKNIKPGDYTVRITYTDYKPFETSVTVSKEKEANLLVQLQFAFKELADVVVVSGANASEKNTRSLERNSNQLVNIVSSRNMELLPDITVANVMGRVSGVTIERNSSGEARYPIIRGMEKRYINTLVNGIKIPSPDN